MSTPLIASRVVKSCWLLFACSGFCFGQTLSVRADALDNWSTNQITTNTYGLVSVIYTNGLYVGVGGGEGTDFGFIATSPDGLNWTLRQPANTPQTVCPLAVGYGQGQYIAVGYYGVVYGSTDGIDWLLRTYLPIQDLSGVAFGSGHFVVVGDVEQGVGVATVSNICSSVNGTNWIQRSSGSPANDPHVIQDVAYGANKFVAVGDGGFVYTSETASSWTRQSIASVGLYSIGYCNGQFIVPVGPGINLISADGLTWNAVATGLSITLIHPVYSHGTYLAIGLYGGFYDPSSLCASADGTNWIERSLQFTHLTDVAIGNRVVAVAATGSGQYTANAFVFVSDPLADLKFQSGLPPNLILSGMTGGSYRIDFANTLTSGSNSWQPLTNFTLSTSPYTFTDTSASNAPARFYRSVLLP